MKNLALILLVCNFSFSFSQDTIAVQTFTYDSISTRRAIFNFPPELQTLEFEKVLMYYNLKCDPLTPWDSYNCGEWDYLTYSKVFDHTGNYDSVKVEMSHYLVNGQNTATINYVNQPYYNYYNNYQKFITYSAELDNDYTIGTGTDLINYPFGTQNQTQRTQILWTASEISAALITAGEIAKLRFDVTTLGNSMGHLTIKMKHTSATDLAEFDETGWYTVYDMNTNFLTTGINTINLTYPFLYDGTSSILMDISFDNGIALGTNHELNASTTSNNSVVFSNEDLGHLKINPGEWLDVDLTNYDFQNEITISFWASGESSYLPVNTSILEGYDSLNNRIVNIHMPWSNERIYWDAGTGSGYDRIDKLATISEYEGNWHHWTFTKNSTTGVMNIYMDGVLWHTGSAKNLPVGIVNKFRIGSSPTGSNPYAGLLDEFRIWDVEIAPAEIAAWQNKKVDASHPNYANLVLYYDFDNAPSVIDQSLNNHNGALSNPSMVQFSNSQTGETISNQRPNITFVQGIYTSQLDSVLMIDSSLVAPIDIAEYQVDGRKFTIASIQNKWAEAYSYEYDYLGVKTDSTWHAADVSFLNDSIHYYKAPFEIITPYGIGFTLGPNGFTYVYDVTDYQQLLQGAVDFEAHNTQELIDVKFLFITGTPPRDLISVEQLWGGLGNYSYANLDNDVSLSAYTVNPDPSGAMFKVRSRITGHGHNGSNNCCEWGNGQGRDHELLIDGTPRFTWDIWQETECGDNPNIKQGGTWPYAREGWCPGDIVEDHEFDITPYITPGVAATIDYDIEDVPAGDPAQGNGNYVINMHMITYGAPNFSNDAAIVDVLNPNKWEYYSKWNPTCQNPRIILRNTGSTNLTSATIRIWIGADGNNFITHNWTGNLAFLEEEIVEIPITPQWWQDYLNVTTFTALIEGVNGTSDEYSNNNKYTVEFTPSEFVSYPIYIWFKTNNKAVENDLFLRDQNGNIVFSRTVLANTTEYKDTFDLPMGCYTIEITDSDHDGLGFWYSNQTEGETSGFLRVRKVGGSTIYTFPNDFGRYSSFSFSVDYALGIEEKIEDFVFSVYPNPNRGVFSLNLDNFQGDELTIEVCNELGAIIYSDAVLDNNAEGYLQKEINLDGVPAGLYFVKVTSENRTATKKIIIQ